MTLNPKQIAAVWESFRRAFMTGRVAGANTGKIPDDTPVYCIERITDDHGCYVIPEPMRQELYRLGKADVQVGVLPHDVFAVIFDAPPDGELARRDCVVIAQGNETEQCTMIYAFERLRESKLGWVLLSWTKISVAQSQTTQATGTVAQLETTLSTAVGDNDMTAAEINDWGRTRASMLFIIVGLTLLPREVVERQSTERPISAMRTKPHKLAPSQVIRLNLLEQEYVKYRNSQRATATGRQLTHSHQRRRSKPIVSKHGKVYTLSPTIVRPDLPPGPTKVRLLT